MSPKAIDMVDVAFALRGDSIPADHGWDLYRLLSERLDWLADEPNAGVHPIRGAGTVMDQIYLGSRARLMLRLPQARVEQSFALSGALLDLGSRVEVGSAHLRSLFAHGTLYSQFVNTGTSDEGRFQRDISAELHDIGVGCKLIIGRMRRAQAQGVENTGFSLMLHELSAEDSLRMQALGLGTGRKFGCGIFVPHKSAAAVGA